MNTQNITLSLPKEIIRKVKIIAAQQGLSISGLMSRTLEEIVTKDEGYQVARRRHKALLDTDIDLGTESIPHWTRDALHDR